MTEPTTRPLAVVVDDLDLLRELTANVLKQKYDVMEYGSGEAALAAIKEMKTRPAVLVTDDNMPGMSGVDLVARLKSSPGTASIPMLLVSGEIEGEDGVKAKLKSERLENVHTLEKPFTGDRLLKAVDEAVAGLPRAQPSVNASWQLRARPAAPIVRAL